MMSRILFVVVSVLAGAFSSLYAVTPEALWNQAGMSSRNGSVEGVTVSPRGTWWAATSSSYQIRIGKVADGSITSVLYAERTDLSTVFFTADEQHLVTASNSPVAVWDITTQTVERTLELRNNGKVMIGVLDGIVSALSPDNTMLFTGGQWLGDDTYTLALWDFSSGELLYTLENLSSAVLSIAVTPDNSTLVYSLGDGTVVSWDIATRTPIKTIMIPLGRLAYLSCASTGGYIASITSQNSRYYVRVYKASTLEVIRSFETHYFTRRVDFSPDGSRIIVPDPASPLSGGSYSVGIWDIQSGVLTGRVTSERLRPSDIYCPPALQGNFVMMEIRDGAMTDVASLETYQVLRSILSLNADFVSIGFSPDGRRLGALLKNRKICLYDAATGRLLQETFASLGSIEISKGSIAFSPDGKLLSVTGDSNSVYVWNLKDNTQSGRYDRHTASVLSTAFSSDSRYLASCGLDHTIVIYDIETGAVVDRLMGYNRPLYHVRWTPNDKEIIGVASMAGGSGSGNEIIVWNRTTGSLSRTPDIAPELWLQVARKVHSSVDGRYVAVGLTVWDRLHGTSQYVEAEPYISDIDLTSSGNFMSMTQWRMALDTNSHIEVWNVTNGERVFSRKIYDEVLYSRNDAHLQRREPVHSFTALSPDGSLVAAGSDDGILQVWDVGRLTTTAVDEREAPIRLPYITVQPNPSTELLIVRGKIELSARVNIRLYDAGGIPIPGFENSMTAVGDFQQEFKISHLPSGIYYCEVAVYDDRQVVPVIIIH